MTHTDFHQSLPTHYLLLSRSLSLVCTHFAKTTHLFPQEMVPVSEGTSRYGSFDAVCLDSVLATTHRSYQRWLHTTPPHHLQESNSSSGLKSQSHPNTDQLLVPPIHHSISQYTPYWQQHSGIQHPTEHEILLDWQYHHPPSDPHVQQRDCLLYHHR